VTSATRERKSWGDEPALKVVLEQNPQAPARARAAVEAFCEQHEMADAVLATVRLLVSEVVTNAVVHPAVDAAATVELFVRLEPSLIRVEVVDEGDGFVPAIAPRTSPPADSGYGLFLVEREAARWGVDRTTGNRVWFEVAL
jgi:anti-sigma regulatory factor (Ser/Thr protein kinase)